MNVVFTVFPENKDRNIGTELAYLPEGAQVSRAVYDEAHLEEYYQALSKADAVITDFAPIDRAAIDRMAHCRIIALETTGYNFVDVEYAKQKNIAVSYISEYCTQEVADHAMALILALERRLPFLHQQIEHDGAWEMESIQELGVRRIEGQIMGILGFGKIGRAVAKRALGFGMEVIAYDPYIPKDAGKELGVRITDLEELLAQADIISIHMNLTKENTGLFNMEMFRKLRKRPFIINVARGGAIVEADLAQALDENLVQGAGLDVLESENPDLERNPLMHRNNVILTPHTAFYSDDSYQASLRIAAQNVSCFFEGKLDRICSLL